MVGQVSMSRCCLDWEIDQGSSLSELLNNCCLNTAETCQVANEYILLSCSQKDNCLMPACEKYAAPKLKNTRVNCKNAFLAAIC